MSSMLYFKPPYTNFDLNPPAANRLDRLTSGLMIMALSPTRARQMCEEFFAGGVKKEVSPCRLTILWSNALASTSHDARANFRGIYHYTRSLHWFIESRRTEIICEEPMLTVDRQMGLNIVHTDGKVTLQHTLRVRRLTSLLACKNVFHSIILRPDHGH